MAPKPNLAYVRAFLTEPRQYPPHLAQDLTQLVTNCSAVLDWAEFLESQLSGCGTEFRRVEAERDSLRVEYARLASGSDQVALGQLRVELEEARAVIAQRDAAFRALEQAASGAVAAVQRVAAVLDRAEGNVARANPDSDLAHQPSFILTSTVREALGDSAEAAQ